MTRINLGIPPEELCDKHLVAEWRELPRARHYATYDERPEQAAPRLGKGHVLFFSDKGAYLIWRHTEIYHEMVYRGMKPDTALLLTSERWHGAYGHGTFGMCPVVSKEWIDTIRARILSRLPPVVKYTSRSIPEWVLRGIDRLTN